MRWTRIAAASTLAIVAGPLVVVALPAVEPEPGPVAYEATFSVPEELGGVDLAVYSVTLVDCEPRTSVVDDLRSLLGAVPVLGGGSVEAGHSSDADPAEVVGPWRPEAGETVALGEAWLDEAAYCEAHIAFAWREDGEIANSGPTLSVVANDEAGETVGETAGETVSTTESWGVILPLTDPDGAPVTISPRDPVMVVFELAIGDDILDLADGVADGVPLGPRDYLRSIVTGSVAISTQRGDAG